MRKLPCLIAVSLGLAACAPPAPPPSTPPPEVLFGTAAVRPTAAMLNPYVGQYRSAAGQLTVRRAGNSLVIQRPGQPQLGLSVVGLGTFADIGGNTYLFGSGAGGSRLSILAPDGRRSEWTR